MTEQRSPAARAAEQLPPKANLRPAEVAAFLGFSVDTVYDLIHIGAIPAVRFARNFVIPRAQFLAAYQQNAFQPDL